MEGHVGQLAGLVEELALEAEMLADLIEQGDQGARFKLMLPGIKPDHLDVSAGDPVAVFARLLFEPSQSLAGFVEAFYLTVFPFNLTTQIRPKLMQKAGLTRAPRTTDADDIGRM